ncbi:sugar phosphate isomerase/epimerase [Cohnella sp. CFH 77786]|uniref:sugar phosphate isomerase/epimerase family protein n=1 Tax=Cohnella sp. CFH 77786 TaxID=2662265 RepID=UPI001C609712|nr:sugar phosphate isomerase/epimerase [Cohnella sp. CFH 77786]
MKRFPIGVQPYTVRELMAQDYTGTLEKLAAIGYRGVELGLPPAGMTVAEQKRLLGRLGLQVIGTHGPFDSLEADWEALFRYLDETGGRFIALSLKFASKEEVLAKSQELNRIGRKCKEAGVQLLYHNHDWEFVRFDGVSALDWLLQETDPEWVKMELDTYWVARGGEDPAAYLGKLKGRCPLLHIKDMEAGEEKFFAEIGEGVLDFVSIARAAEEAGTEWLIVEQDQSRRDPIESLTISWRHLQRMGLTGTNAEG